MGMDWMANCCKFVFGAVASLVNSTSNDQFVLSFFDIL